MWETLHLFSRNAKKYSVSSVSSVENTVSAYSSINESADSMTIIIVNRDMNSSQNVTVNLTGFAVNNGNYQTLQLSSLPTTETFVSHTQNALKVSQVSVSSNSLALSVPKLSTTAILLTKPVVQTTYVTLTNRATGLLIDGIGRTTNGDNCGQWSNSGSLAQQWVLETVGSYVKIKNRYTGLYLDGMGRTTNNSIAGQYSSSTSNNQQWQKVASGNYYKFKNRSSGLYLDGLGKTINGADLGQYKSSNSNNQLWTVTTVANTLKALSINNSEEKETHISIYPNPFSNTFNFTINNTEKVTRIEILDMTGKLYEVIDHSSIKNQIELGTSLRPNMYIVKVYGENITKVFKVIKK
jgi:hypothetical protein